MNVVVKQEIEEDELKRETKVIVKIECEPGIVKIECDSENEGEFIYKQLKSWLPPHLKTLDKITVVIINKTSS